MIPKRIRTYLIGNILIAVLLVVFMAMRASIVSLLFIVALMVLPFALVEIYLYPKKKGIWYDFKRGPRHPAPDFAPPRGELIRRKSEALRRAWQLVKSQSRAARIERSCLRPVAGKDRFRGLLSN